MKIPTAKIGTEDDILLEEVNNDYKVDLERNVLFLRALRLKDGAERGGVLRGPGEYGGDMTSQ